MGYSKPTRLLKHKATASKRAAASLKRATDRSNEGQRDVEQVLHQTEKGIGRCPSRPFVRTLSPAQGQDHAKSWRARLFENPRLLASDDAPTQCLHLLSVASGAPGRLSGSHKDRLMLKRTLQSTGEGVLNSSSSCSSPEDASAALHVCWSAATWAGMTSIMGGPSTHLFLWRWYCSGTSRLGHK